MIWNWYKISNGDLEKAKEKYYDAFISLVENLYDCILRCFEWCVDGEDETSKIMCEHLCESICREALGVEEDEDL